MYATVRTYRGNPDQMDEMLHKLDGIFMPRISQADGFCGYQAIDTGDGGLVTVSCFESLGQAEASTEMAAMFIQDELSDFDLERTDVRSGDVRVSKETDAVLQEAHV
jgi:hypothetical protein